MDLSVFSTAIQNALGEHLPAILGAVGILVVGYLIALLARAAVRKLLSMLRVNSFVSSSVGKPMDVEGGVALGAFWFILLATILGVFNTLNLDQLSGPFAEMMSQIMTYLPHLLAGVLLVAWLAATVVKGLANRALKATQWDEKLVENAGMSPMGDSVGNVLFWLVILMFLPAVLGVMQLDGMLDPVRDMVSETLAMLPNIFAAAIIVLAGWLVAKILRGLVTNLLAAVGADKLGESAGMQDRLELSKLAGLLVFILVFVPVLIAALDALQITAISGPATEMLGMMMQSIPNIFAAVLILFITWYVARFAAGLLGGLLVNMGLNNLPAKMGMEHIFSEDFKASDLVTRVMVFFAMLFATVEASHRLDFTQVESLVSMFIQFGGDVLLGVGILLIGFWLANLAYRAIMRASGDSAIGMASIARYAILGLVVAMGPSAMGIADEIVNLAFLLVFGAVAVAIALSFGLGGREAAGKQMEHWLAKLRKDKQD
ncbi:MAG: mechanosensitive ion channel [Sulfuriferula multivorans]|uniref:Small-conductance mechanosensitive channel n=1 Tax=Sulfuriferula multivorans TaxID=1559896 RepID=A0A7C9JWL6_9PROT|nr:mechanosensitive ion channel [Sulfuriferula multivorans]